MTRDRFQLEPFGRPRKPVNVIGKLRNRSRLFVARLDRLAQRRPLAPSARQSDRRGAIWPRRDGESRARARDAPRRGPVGVSRVLGDRASPGPRRRGGQGARGRVRRSGGVPAEIGRALGRTHDGLVRGHVQRVGEARARDAAPPRARRGDVDARPHTAPRDPAGALPPVCTSVEMVHPANVSTLEARAALARLVGEMTDATRRGMLWNAACVPLTMPLMLTPISNFPAYWFGWRAWTQRRASGAGRALRRVVEMSGGADAWRARERLEGMGGGESPSAMRRGRFVGGWSRRNRASASTAVGRTATTGRAVASSARRGEPPRRCSSCRARCSTTRAARSRPRVESLEVGVGSRRSSGRCTRRG